MLKNKVFNLSVQENNGGLSECMLSTRSVFKSFSPFHTRTLRKRWKYDSTPYRACVLLVFHDVCMMYDIMVFEKNSVFVLPHVNEKPAFWKISFLETVFKNLGFCGGKTTFTCGRKAETEKKNRRFQKIRIRLDGIKLNYSGTRDRTKLYIM